MAAFEGSWSSSPRAFGNRRRGSANLILKEGFLYKKGGIIKSWSRRYFILNKQSLCYFKREQATSDGTEGLHPLGRIFLSDVVNIETEGTEKKKAFVFALHTKKRAVLLQAANNEDRDTWVDMIRRALESEGEAERKDPFRRTLRKLAPGVKRITLFRDPEKGIGCTIKNAAGHILVNRIIEDGPIALTGVLRPGDEILDIHGTSVAGLQVVEVVEVIRNAPEEFLVTVRPITALKVNYKADTSRINYSTILPQTTPTSGTTPTFIIHSDTQSAPPPPPPADSRELEDVGNYDDEDEGDMPPPLPPRTENTLILVDPPPLGLPPPRPAKAREPSKLALAAARPREHHGSTGELPRRRPRMMKSHSQGDSIDDDDSSLFVPGGQGSPRPPRVHNYEEIRPKLTYVDIDIARNRERAAARTHH